MLQPLFKSCVGTLLGLCLLAELNYVAAKPGHVYFSQGASSYQFDIPDATSAGTSHADFEKSSGLIFPGFTLQNVKSLKPAKTVDTVLTEASSHVKSEAAIEPKRTQTGGVEPTKNANSNPEIIGAKKVSEKEIHQGAASRPRPEFIRLQKPQHQFEPESSESNYDSRSSSENEAWSPPPKKFHKLPKCSQLKWPISNPEKKCYSPPSSIRTRQVQPAFNTRLLPRPISPVGPGQALPNFRSESPFPPRPQQNFAQSSNFHNHFSQSEPRRAPMTYAEYKSMYSNNQQSYNGGPPSYDYGHRSTASGPSYNYGQQPTTAAPSYSYGGQSTTSGPSYNYGQQKSSSGYDKGEQSNGPSYNYGRQDTTPAPNNYYYQSSTTAAPPSYNYGQQPQSSYNNGYQSTTESPKYNGYQSPPKPPPSYTYSQTQSPPSYNYGQQSTTQKPPSYSYGHQSTTKAPSYNYGQQSTTQSPPSYNYGQQSTTQAPPSYSYGQQSTTQAPASYYSGYKSETQAPPSYNYGQQSTTQSPPSYNYGQQSTTQAPPSYRYGQQSTTQSPPSYNYGQQSTTQSPPSYNYGQQSTTQAPPSYSYGQQSTTQSPPSYNYGQQSTTQSPPSYNYGQQSTTQSPPSYNYGQQSTTQAPPSYSYGQQSTTQSPSSYNYGQESTTQAPPSYSYGQQSTTQAPQSYNYGQTSTTTTQSPQSYNYGTQAPPNNNGGAIPVRNDGYGQGNQSPPSTTALSTGNKEIELYQKLLAFLLQRLSSSNGLSTLPKPQSVPAQQGQNSNGRQFPQFLIIDRSQSMSSAPQQPPPAGSAPRLLPRPISPLISSPGRQNLAIPPSPPNNNNKVNEKTPKLLPRPISPISGVRQHETLPVPAAFIGGPSDTRPSRNSYQGESPPPSSTTTSSPPPYGYQSSTSDPNSGGAIPVRNDGSTSGGYGQDSQNSKSSNGYGQGGSSQMESTSMTPPPSNGYGQPTQETLTIRNEYSPPAPKDNNNGMVMHSVSVVSSSHSVREATSSEVAEAFNGFINQPASDPFVFPPPANRQEESQNSNVEYGQQDYNIGDSSSGNGKDVNQFFPSPPDSQNPQNPDGGFLPLSPPNNEKESMKEEKPVLAEPSGGTGPVNMEKPQMNNPFENSNMQAPSVVPIVPTGDSPGSMSIPQGPITALVIFPFSGNDTNINSQLESILSSQDGSGLKAPSLVINTPASNDEEKEILERILGLAKK